MKRFLNLFLITLLSVSFAFISCDEDKGGESTCDVCGNSTCVCIIATGYRVPYQDVNWGSYGQFKGSFHVHTWASDGSNPLTEMVETYYDLDYDILSITDHNYGRMGSQTADVATENRKTFPLTIDWLQHNRDAREIPLTQQRFDEVTTGVGRNGRGILLD